MHKEYMPSKFNVAVKDEERYCVFNSLFGSLAVIEDENIIKIISGEKSADEVDSKILMKLCEQGFICTSDVEEESICNVKKMDMICDSHLHLNIMPSYECNFRCAYCYQNFPEAEDNFPKIEMPKEIQESIVKYVRKEIINFTGLIVEWYGGEPLLKKDIILQISNRLIEISKKMGKPYFSTITTNGYLLDVNTFRELLKSKIIKYHVTLDGFELVHNAQRFLKTGQGTYSVILDNLIKIRDEVKSSDFNIVIRVNVTKALLPRLQEWIVFLHEQFSNDNRFKFFIRCVENRGGKAIERMMDDVVNDDDEVFKIIRDANIDLDYSFYYYGTLINSICLAAKRNAYLIDPQGNIRKCGEYLRDDRTIIGYLNENGRMEIDRDKFARWFNDRVIDRDECKMCKMMPACNNSACPMRADIINENSKLCSYEHRNIKNILKVFLKYNNYDFIYKY